MNEILCSFVCVRVLEREGGGREKGTEPAGLFKEKAEPDVLSDDRDGVGQEAR
jgi:hypothetical protein